MPIGPQSELLEFTIQGPFGGIQSEAPPERIENSGFADVNNILFHRGEARVRPRSNDLPVQPASPDPGLRIIDLVGEIQDQTWTPSSLRLSTGLVEAWVGVADFFNVDGNRLQVAMTPTRMLQWVGGGWSVLPGGFSGLVTDKFSSAVVAEKLCTCQGVDKVMLWDGQSTSFGEIADSVPSKFLMELANHLIACRTIEGGGKAYQRVRWTGADDPTDWTSLNSGQIDLFNDLGPINGCVKLFRFGYIFQQKGIVQVIPTGIGTNAFVFQALSSSAKGLTCPYSLAVNGETDCAYVGKDNVYAFDGTSSTPIGDMPMANGGRVGARKRIFADLMHSEPDNVVGFVTTSINGNPFNAYWLVIPEVATWVFNYDEMNWTRLTWANKISVIGNFQRQGPIRIADLIGAIGQQAWSPATLLNNNPFDSLFLGYANGNPGIFDFTGWSEEPWYIETGQMAFGNFRYEKVIKKLRLVYRDYGEATINVQIVNDRGQVWAPSSITANPDEVTETLVGNGGGRTLSTLMQPSISGMFNTIRISGAPDQPFAFTELTSIYSVGGEQRFS